MPSRAERARGLSNLSLKVIGLVLVAVSAAGTSVVQRGMPTDLAQADFTQLTFSVLLEAVSWTALPIYAWLLVSGFAHTSSVARYGCSLLVLAVVSEAPYDLATTGRLWDLSSQNPVFALAVCLVVVYALDRFSRLPRDRSLAFSVMVVIAGAFWMLLFNVGLRLGVLPGGLVLLAFALIFRGLARRENVMNWVGAVVGALAGIFPAFGLVVLHFRNGELGTSTPAGKWFFYAAYPVCLLTAWWAGSAL